MTTLGQWWADYGQGQENAQTDWHTGTGVYWPGDDTIEAVRGEAYQAGYHDELSRLVAAPEAGQ